MKRNIITAVILIMFSFSILPAAEKIKEKSFSGRVIFVSDSNVELKIGMTEITIDFAEDSKFINIDRSEGTKDIIKLCQMAKAYYVTADSKKILKKIIVTRESDCKKKK